jgi:hypothetical protein
MKLAYAEISEATHFGAVAMCGAHDIVDEDDSTAETSWTSYPRWRSENKRWSPAHTCLGSQTRWRFSSRSSASAICCQLTDAHPRAAWCPLSAQTPENRSHRERFPEVSEGAQR